MLRDAFVTRGCVSRIYLWPIIRDEESWLAQVGRGVLNGQSTCRLAFVRGAITSPRALGKEVARTERQHNPPHRSKICEGGEGTGLEIESPRVLFLAWRCALEKLTGPRYYSWGSVDGNWGYIVDTRSWLIECRDLVQREYIKNHKKWNVLGLLGREGLIREVFVAAERSKSITVSDLNKKQKKFKCVPQ